MWKSAYAGVYQLLNILIDHLKLINASRIINLRRCESDGLRRRSWLKHCATSRKVAGSILNLVIGLCNGPGVTSFSIRNGYQECLPWDKGRAYSLTAFMCRLSGNMGTWICVRIALPPPVRIWEISLSLRQLHIWEAAVGIECTESCMGPSDGRDGGEEV